MKNKRNDFLLHTHFLTRIIISLFYCCKKVFYLCKDMDDWEKNNETLLLDYAYAERVCTDFETKNLREFYDLPVPSNTLLLADIFENFRNMCLENI